MSSYSQDVNKALGDKVMARGDDPRWVTQLMSTGMLPVDDLMGGGVTRGAQYEVYGASGTLKSAFAYLSAAAAVNRGETVAIIDVERALDPNWLVKLGLDLEKIEIARPESAEDVINTCTYLCKQGIDLFIVDSIAALSPEQMLDTVAGKDNAPGMLARVMSRGMNRINSANTKSTGIWINQTRENIGVMFGPKTTTPGGKAMGYYASARFDFSKIGTITEEFDQYDLKKMAMAKVKAITHEIIKVKATKTRQTTTAPEVQFAWDIENSCVDLGLYAIQRGYQTGKIVQNGMFYEINGLKIKGKDNMIAHVKSDLDTQDFLLS